MKKRLTILLLMMGASSLIHQVKAQRDFFESLTFIPTEYCDRTYKNIDEEIPVTYLSFEINPPTLQSVHIRMYQQNGRFPRLIEEIEMEGPAFDCFDCETVYFRLSDFRQLTYGEEYLFSVAAKIRGVIGNYSQPNCIMRTGPIPVTKMGPGLCGQTITDLESEQSFSAVAVPLAEAYKFGLYDSKGKFLLEEATSADHRIALNEFESITYGNSYQLKVAVVARGKEGGFSTACPFSVAQRKPPSIEEIYCGQSYDDLATTITSTVYPGAERYFFGLFDADGTTLSASFEPPNQPNRTISLSDFNTMTYGQAYSIRVRAIIKRNPSDFGEACPVLLTERQPLAPAELTLNVLSASEIQLQWQDRSLVETEYIVQRYDTQNNSYQDVAVLPANTTSYLDAGLHPNTDYSYRIFAKGNYGLSEPSEQQTARTAIMAFYYPKGGEVYFQGHPIPVAWQGFPKKVQREVLLYLKDENGVEFQVAQTEDDGKFKWEYEAAPYLGQYKMILKTKLGAALCETAGYFKITASEISPINENQVFRKHFRPKLDEYYQNTHGDSLRFVLEERHQHGELLSASIRDWTDNKIVDLPLVSDLGRNGYALNIGKRGIGLEKEQYYLLQLTYTDGFTERLRFKRTELDPVTAEIEMAINNYSCTVASANDIDFQCKAAGGVEPYLVDWYLSATPDASAATRFETDRYSNDPKLYLASPDIDSEAKFKVYDLPEYYITMKVTDACGQEVKQLIKVSCADRTSPNHQIGIEIIDIITNTGG